MIPRSMFPRPGMAEHDGMSPADALTRVTAIGDLIAVALHLANELARLAPPEARGDAAALAELLNDASAGVSPVQAELRLAL